MNRRIWVWLAAITALLVATRFTIPQGVRYYHEHNTPDSKANIDFFAYHTAARALALGLDPYRDNSGIDPTLSDSRGNGWSRFIYPAALLPVLRPLARMDYERARALWLGLNLSIFAVGFLAVVATRQPRDRALTGLVGLWTVACSHPLLFHVRQGQADLIVATLTTLAFVLSQRGARSGSAALLAISSWIKVHSVPMLATLVVHSRDKRYAWLFVAYAVAIGLASLALVPLSYHVEYLTKVLPAISHGSDYFYNQSLTRLVPQTGAWPRIVSLAGFAGMTVFAWYVSRPVLPDRIPDSDGEGTRDLLFLVNVLVLLLFSPIAWHMAYVWSILPAALAAPTYARRVGPARIVCGAVVLALMHVRVAGRPVQNTVNMFGAAVLLALVVLSILRPRVRSVLRTPRHR